jgi:isochorismate synthase
MTVTTHIADGLGLLERYVPGRGTLLASPNRTVLTQGVIAVVPAGARGDQLADLPQRARASLEDSGGPLVIGALPFDIAAPARLVVPATVDVAAPLALWPDDAQTRVVGGRPDVQSVPEPEHFAASVGTAVNRVREGALHKVMLARSVELSGGGDIDVAALVRNLAARDPRAQVFAVDISDSSPGPRTLVGASPELLVRRRGLEVSTLPLAGSAARSDDPIEDALRAAALLGSEKDRQEHAILVESVAAALRPLCDVLEVPAGPELMRTGAMWHLASPIRGRLAHRDTCSLTLVAALHPTPAVCGQPVAAARAAIAELEGRDRDFYAGAVGWQDDHGDGEWTVTIRCGEVCGDRVRLWAGAGIVGASDPRAELAETTAKTQTMLDAMGLT